MMYLVTDLLLICVLYLVWLPTTGTSQQITAEQFQLLVEERVRYLAQSADDAYLDIIVNVTGNQSCPYGNRLYDTCNDTLQLNGITFDEAYRRNISVSASSVYFIQFLAGYASLYSTIDDYRPVEDLFARLCMSEALSNAWIDYSNSSTSSINDGLLLHFYGDQESGIIRTHPYFSHDPSSDVCRLRQLDPRFRPWYVSTVTASKAVYVLLHSNKFDMLPLMREAAVKLLNTLSHQDYFFIWYSNGSRFSDNFVLTNESTRMKIEKFINSTTQQPLNPSLGIGNHLTEVISLYGSLNLSVCHQIIMIMSDSTLDHSIVDAVNRSKQESGVQKLDIYTMIFGIEADDRYAALLSCSNGGDHFVVTDFASVNEAIASYYRVYSAAVTMETEESEVSWSEVYSDFFLATDVLSACLPVRDVYTAELLGVTCVDVNVTFFRSLDNSDEVISGLINNSSVTCPTTDITEELRNRWRTYRYCERPANLSTIEQVITLYEDSVIEVIDLLILARPLVLNITLCPFGSTVYDACNDDTLPYSFSSRLGNNISNLTSNVNFSPTTASLLRNVSLVSYSTDNPLFEPLCYSSIADRQWYKLLTLSPRTALQYYASDKGFVRLYPAIRYSQCYPPSLDPRTRPFYAAAASGRKDVVMVIDILNDTSVPVATAAVRDILNTLSVIDYFNVISANGLFRAGLVAATIANKMNVNATYLPNIVAMAIDQSLLVTMAFQAITDGYTNNNTANCQISIIIITDRQITRDTGKAVANGTSNIQPIAPVKMFVTSLTNDLTGYYDDIAVQLTCNHSGIWNKVSSSTYSHSSTASVISYYRVLASAVMVTEPVWSEIYEDFTGAGDVVTVCQPHYDETITIGQLLGVACADVSIDMLQQVGASLDFISSLIDRQHSLSCYQSQIPVATLESLRPIDAKCLSAPPTISVTEIISSTSVAMVTSSVIVTTTIASSAIVTETTGLDSSPTPTTNSTSSGSSSSSSLSGGAIAGIIVACVVVLTILLIILIGYYQYHNIRLYRVHGGRDYKTYTQGKEFINNDLSDALISEVENDEKDEL